MMRQRNFNWIPAALVAVVALVAIAGCNETSTPVGGTSGDVVISSLTVSNASPEVGSNAVVEATVQDGNGAAQAGVWVTFSVLPTTAGTFVADSSQTDASGVASTIFNAAAEGSASISASLTSGANLSRPVLVQAAGGGGGTVDTGSGLVSVAVSPKLIRADGTTQATITITAYTPASQLVPDSTAIKIAAGEWFVDVDGDGYFTPAVDTLKVDYNGNSLWDAIGVIPNVAYTTNGVATVTYTAGSIAGTVYFKATVGEPGSSYYGANTLTLTPNDSVANIELVASQPDLQVHGTGGDDFTDVEASCFDANGNRAPEGLAVSLQILSGPGGGENIDGDASQPVTKFTNASGKVTWTVASGTISGTIRVRATAGTVLSTATQIVVNAGPPFEISIGAKSCNVQSYFTVNVRNPIVAAIVDAYGNPVPKGTAVYFSTEEGMVTAYDITEENGGLAFADWLSGDPANDGVVWIWAETAGGTVRDSVAFISSGPPASITKIAGATSLPATADASTMMKYEVLDINGNPVVELTPIKLHATYGNIGDGATEGGCFYSTLEQEFTSEAPTEDYSPVSPDDGIAAIAEITASSELVQRVDTVLLLSGTAYFRNSTMEYWGTMVYGVSVPVEVTIKDHKSVPLAGHSITLTATSGAVSGSPAITNRYGVATFSYTAPADSTIAKSAYLTATDNDPRGGISIAQKVTFQDFIRQHPGDDAADNTVASFPESNDR